VKRFCPLASGSKGNCTFVETAQTRLLFDAGISLKAVVDRLAELEVEPESIDGVVISHEHIDHIRSLGPLVSRYGIPLLANAETAKAIYAALGFLPAFKIFTTGERFEYKGITIHPFSVSHDAVDPVAFTLTCQGWKIGICTDLGFASAPVITALEGCTHLVLEANHEPRLVHASGRPEPLKQRILGRSGHLSNQAAGKLLAQLVHDGLEDVYLAHLSEECNHPDLALRRVSEEAGSHTTRLHVAHQRQKSHCLSWSN
jgi:phosphoribosyl 1,2-cyclic phosphodiesterase